MGKDPCAETTIRTVHYAVEQARVAFPQADPRLMTLEALEALAYSKDIWQDFADRTATCMLDTLKSYLGAGHLAIVVLSVDLGLESRANLSWDLAEEKMIELMQGYEGTPLDWEGARLLLRIADSTLILLGHLEIVDQVSHWLMHKLKTNQHNLDSQEICQVTATYWTLQAGMAKVRKDAEAQASAFLQVLNCHTEDSATAYERIMGVSLCVERLQQFGDVFCELIDDIEASIHDKFSETAAETENEGVDPETAKKTSGVHASSTKRKNRYRDSGGRDDQDLPLDWPQALREGDYDVSFGWSPTGNDVAMPQSRLHDLDVFSEPMMGLILVREPL